MIGTPQKGVTKLLKRDEDEANEKLEWISSTTVPASAYRQASHPVASSARRAGRQCNQRNPDGRSAKPLARHSLIGERGRIVSASAANLWFYDRMKVVGPAGFEPATKGFTSAPMFPKGVDYLFTRAEQVEGGGVRDALACDQGQLELDPRGSNSALR
jgi:hypothetical protein